MKRWIWKHQQELSEEPDRARMDETSAHVARHLTCFMCVEVTEHTEKYFTGAERYVKGKGRCPERDRRSAAMEQCAA